MATAANLPFADDTFDLAIAYNLLMDIEDVPTALREIRRVLRPSGTLVISIVHPFADRGHFAGPEPDAPFVIHNSYFGRECFEAVEERNGLEMHFAGWSQPLENYMLALEAQDSPSQRFGSRFRTLVRHGATWSGGAGFPCSFG